MEINPSIKSQKDQWEITYNPSHIPTLFVAAMATPPQHNTGTTPVTAAANPSPQDLKTMFRIATFAHTADAEKKTMILQGKLVKLAYKNATVLSQITGCALLESMRGAQLGTLNYVHVQADGVYKFVPTPPDKALPRVMTEMKAVDN